MKKEDLKEKFFQLKDYFNDRKRYSIGNDISAEDFYVSFMQFNGKR